MYKARAVSNVAGFDCSVGDNAGTGDGTMGDTNRLKEAKDKIDITTPDKTNKTLIFICY